MSCEQGWPASSSLSDVVGSVLSVVILRSCDARMPFALCFGYAKSCEPPFCVVLLLFFLAALLTTDGSGAEGTGELGWRARGVPTSLSGIAILPPWAEVPPGKPGGYALQPGAFETERRTGFFMIRTAAGSRWRRARRIPPLQPPAFSALLLLPFVSFAPR